VNDDLTIDEPRQPLPPLRQTRHAEPIPAGGKGDARKRLALDLSHGDADKAAALLALPLFAVATDGNDAL
jgi:hypothetical protein